MMIVCNKNRILKVCIDYMALNKVIVNVFFCFLNNTLEEVTCHAMYSFLDRCSGINQNHGVQGDGYIMTCITYWVTFFYIVMPFRFKHETLIMMFAIRKYRYQILINKNNFFMLII